MLLTLKRSYEPKTKADGFRILVDRLWPRGLKKEDLHIDIWLKEVARLPVCTNGLTMILQNGNHSNQHILLNGKN